MRISYIGMFDEVHAPDVTDAIPGKLSVRRGEVITVPDELGERLLQQPANWAKAGGGKASPSA